MICSHERKVVGAKLPEGIRKRYKGEIDRFVTEVLNGDSVRLDKIVKTDAFVRGNYVGFQGRVWHVDNTELVHLLLDPPIFNGLCLKLSEHK